MNWMMALILGVGVGLAFFGGLWLTVCRTLRGPGGRALMIGSAVTRLALAGLVFLALSREGVGCVVAGLIGFLIARQVVVHRIGGMSRGA